jgi:hypothetical protein
MNREEEDVEAKLISTHLAELEEVVDVVKPSENTRRERRGRLVEANSVRALRVLPCDRA